MSAFIRQHKPGHRQYSQPIAGTRRPITQDDDMRAKLDEARRADDPARMQRIMTFYD